jgi:hypothetical protein
MVGKDVPETCGAYAINHSAASSWFFFSTQLTCISAITFRPVLKAFFFFEQLSRGNILLNNVAEA